MKYIFLRNVVMVMLQVVLFFSCKKISSYNYPAEKATAYDIIAGDATNYSTFKYIVDRSGTADLLKKGNITVFAPSNGAFGGAGFASANLQNIPLDSLAIIVKNHLVDGVVDIKLFETEKAIQTLSGETITVKKIGGKFYLDGADITNTSSNVQNGALYTINKVVYRAPNIYDRIFKYYSSNADYSYTLLLTAIDRASQGTVNYNALFRDNNTAYTFFAPTNKAFAVAGYTEASIKAAAPDDIGKLLLRQLINKPLFTSQMDTATAITSMAGELVYHDRINQFNRYTNFYENGLIFYGGYANLMAGKSVLFITNRLMPATINKTTLERIQSDTTLSYFNAALQRASSGSNFDFVKAVSDLSDSYTVFAIDNNGFRKGGYPTIAAIANESPAVLEKLLRYHFSRKRSNSGNYQDGSSMPTLLELTSATGAKSIASIGISNTPSFNVKGPTNIAPFTVFAGNIITNNGTLNVISGILTP